MDSLHQRYFDAIKTAKIPHTVKNFGEYHSYGVRLYDWYKVIDQKNHIRLGIDAKGDTIFNYDPWVFNGEKVDQWFLTDFFVTMRYYIDGPKQLVMSDRQWEALYRVKCSCPIEIFAGPFPTFAVVYPWHDLIALLVHTTKVDGIPIIFTACLSQNMVSTGATIREFKPKGITTLEDAINTPFSPNSPIPFDDGEDVKVKTYTRVCLNFGLLMARYGMTCKTDRRAKERLVKHANKRPTPGNVKQAATYPEKFELAQHVRYRDDARSDGNGEATGRTVSPHWRSGYWRTQWFGEGCTECKPVYIPPVFVNGHLFTGEMGKTAYKKG